MSAKLKPCPCGGLVYVGSYKFIDATLSGIGCMHCGRTTGMTEEKSEAIAAWNRRASPTPEREGGGAIEAAKRIVDWDDNGRLADDEWLVERNETAIIAICRALLSTPVDARREALEEAAQVANEVAADDPDEASAIAAWNRRASPTPAGEEGERDEIDLADLAARLKERVDAIRKTRAFLNENGPALRMHDDLLMASRALLSSPRVEREWCLNCGTVTRDARCHCTEIGQEPNFVNYADELARQMNAAASSPRVERARALEEAAQIADIYVAYAPATEDGDEAARKIAAAIRSLSPTDGAPADTPKVRTP